MRCGAASATAGPSLLLDDAPPARLGRGSEGEQGGVTVFQQVV